MRLVKITFLCSLIIVLSLSWANALEILYPEDGTYVQKSNYLVLKGGTDPMLSGMSIEINGVKSDVIDLTSEAYIAAFGDMLVLEPIFDPGVNVIVVEGYLGGERMAVARSEVYFHDRYDQAPPTDFSREQFHLAEREAPCASCHNMSPTQADFRMRDARNHPCGSCHARMLSKAHVHGPAGVYDCTYCHDLESRPYKYQARSGDGNVCMECHEDKAEAVRSSEFVHGPLEAGMCLVCHDPHATDQPSQLVMPAYELCSGCHENVTKEPHVTRGSGGKPHPLRGVVDPTGDGEDLSCISCHDPHVGKVASLFKWGIESRFAMCGKCHNK
jgi:predicted CXXCH cytochrome family protein